MRSPRVGPQHCDCGVLGIFNMLVVPLSVVLLVATVLGFRDDGSGGKSCKLSLSTRGKDL